MQIWAEFGKSALPICNYSQILYQFLTFTQNLKRSLIRSTILVGIMMVRLLHIFYQFSFVKTKSSNNLVLIFPYLFVICQPLFF